MPQRIPLCDASRCKYFKLQFMGAIYFKWFTSNCNLLQDTLLQFTSNCNLWEQFKLQDANFKHGSNLWKFHIRHIFPIHRRASFPDSEKAHTKDFTHTFHLLHKHANNAYKKCWTAWYNFMDSLITSVITACREGDRRGTTVVLV